VVQKNITVRMDGVLQDKPWVRKQYKFAGVPRFLKGLTQSDFAHCCLPQKASYRPTCNHGKVSALQMPVGAF